MQKLVGGSSTSTDHAQLGSYTETQREELDAELQRRRACAEAADKIQRPVTSWPQNNHGWLNWLEDNAERWLPPCVG